VSEGFKFYLVSDAAGFALTDVYHGYAEALKDLNIPYEEFPYHLFRHILADPIDYNVMHSNILMKHKGFTHAMFIGGLNVPDYLLESLYHVKKVIVSTEDPHSFDPMKRRLDKIDYYFTNERSIASCGRYSNVYYCPTAACSHECGIIPRENLNERYLSDILFLGALYPNRRKILEGLIPFVESNGLTMKICGHVGYMPRNSPLWKYVSDARTIPHGETVMYYNGAKAIINILRDVKWNPRTKSKKNPNNKSRFVPESLNPRAYEVPLCGGLQFLDDSRPEAREVFNDNEVVFFSDTDSLTQGLYSYLIGDRVQKVEEMKVAAYTKVLQNHTYLHRMRHILETLKS
jgi:spore maturation protein CgeB